VLTGVHLWQSPAWVHVPQEVPETVSYIWGSVVSIILAACLYDSSVDLGPTKSKLCLSFLPVVAPQKHDIPFAMFVA
jgi:hypothetical protein